MAPTNDMTEKDVKDAIKSLLTSTPRLSTMQSIQRDYKDMIGQAIPFYKFNFNSLEHFLKSIPDVCTVTGSGPFAQIYPVISEKISHINEMVTRQKQNSRGNKKNFNPRRPRGSFVTSTFSKPRFGFSYSLTPHNSSSASYSSSDGQYGQPYNFKPKSIPPKQAANENPQIKSTYTPVSSSGPAKGGTTQIFQNKDTDRGNGILNPDQNRLGSQQVKEKLDNLIEKQMKVGNVSKPSVTGIAQLSINNVEKWNNSKMNQTPDNAPIERISFIDVEGNQQSKVTSNAKDDSFEKSKEKLNNLLTVEIAKETVDEDDSNVPKRVQVNLRTLISQFEDGIWASDLPGHYRRLFRKDLSFMDYGYTSLIEMCIALKHIFHYVRPGRDDFKLYDRSKPLPPSVEKMYTIASYDLGVKISHDEALPELEWSDFRGHIPDDVYKYGSEIPNQFLPEGSRVESILDVVVVEIYDPSKFWFYLGTSDEPAILDDLMNELQTFYNNTDNVRDYAIPTGALREGLYCVQIIYGEYHRARIVKVLPDNDEFVRVLYIDYGTVAKAPVKGMCFLQSSFAAVPAQALRCRLANIIPLQKGHPWPRSASDRFRELVNRRDTKIKISYIDWGEEYVSAFLADVTDPKNAVYINELLVKEGHALWDGEKQVSPFVMANFKCKVQNVDLFPTFLELEYGLVPSASEMYSLQEMLVPLQFCIPQYFEPNEQVLGDDQSNFDEFENGFIETVKNHRKFMPWSKVDVGKLTTSSALDFDIFGDLKEEMIEFCERINLVSDVQVKTEDNRQDDEFFCDIEEDLLEDKKHCESVAMKDIRHYEPVHLLHEERELSESILQKLEKYSLLSSETSSSPDPNTENANDPLTSFVPQEAELDLYKKCLPQEDIMKRYLLSTIAESENEIDSGVGTPSNPFPLFRMGKDDTDEDINIFDNPEAFSHSSGDTSPNCESPISPEEFLKSVEDKIISNGLGHTTSNSTTVPSSGISSETDNPFKFELKRPSPDVFDMTDMLEALTDCESYNAIADDIFEAPCAKYQNEVVSPTKSNTNQVRGKQEKSEEAYQSMVDLPFKSSLDNTKNDFIGSLSMTNPFRCFLKDNKDNKTAPSVNASVSTVQAAGEAVNTSDAQTDYNTIDSNTQTDYSTDSNTQTDYIPFKDTEVQTSDSDESDHKVFVPKNKKLSTNTSNTGSTTSHTSAEGSSSSVKNLMAETCPTVRMPTRLSTPPDISTPPGIYTPPCISTPPRVAAPARNASLYVGEPPRMSVHAAAFVPMNYQPQYPQWSSGSGYPVPQYPQWSTGNNYPAPYPSYPVPRTNVRPPPGFAPQPYQGLPQNYQNPYMMPRMGPPMYPQFQGMPMYQGVPRQMGPPLPPLNQQEKDFYERFNEELLKMARNQ